MGSQRRSERSVGVLVILGYLAYGIPQGALVLPLLEVADPLTAVAANPLQLTTGALLMAINSAAVVGIGVLLYPILGRHDETVAIGYLGSRVFEGILLAVGIVGILALVPLGQEYVQGTADGPALSALGTVLIQGNFLAYSLGMIALSVGSLPLCYLLYRTRLVPRALAVTGLIGYPALFLLMVMDVFGLVGGPALYALYLPGAIFEIGLALWLLVRGFDTHSVRPAESGSSGSVPTGAE